MRGCMMTNSTLEDQLIEQIRRMNREQQQQMLDYAQSLLRPRGLSGKEMIELARQLNFPKEDLEEMRAAIEEECERI
ncbi:MAG: hypothetical protein WBH90_12350 [Aggregatilineales bacterium]|nr:hypothetical protein [Aggregatilineales bacterium]